MSIDVIHQKVSMGAKAFVSVGVPESVSGFATCPSKICLMHAKWMSENPKHIDESCLWPAGKNARGAPLCALGWPGVSGVFSYGSTQAINALFETFTKELETHLDDYDFIKVCERSLYPNAAMWNFDDGTSMLISYFDVEGHEMEFDGEAQEADVLSCVFGYGVQGHSVCDVMAAAALGLFEDRKGSEAEGKVQEMVAMPEVKRGVKVKKNSNFESQMAAQAASLNVFGNPADGAVP